MKMRMVLVQSLPHFKAHLHHPQQQDSQNKSTTTPRSRRALASFKLLYVKSIHVVKEPGVLVVETAVNSSQFLEPQNEYRKSSIAPPSGT